MEERVYGWYKLTWDVASSFPFSLEGERKRIPFCNQSHKIHSIPQFFTGSFAVDFGDHLRSRILWFQNHLQLGIICGTVQNSILLFITLIWVPYSWQKNLLVTSDVYIYVYPIPDLTACKPYHNTSPIPSPIQGLKSQLSFTLKDPHFTFRLMKPFCSFLNIWKLVSNSHTASLVIHPFFKAQDA